MQVHRTFNEWQVVLSPGILVRELSPRTTLPHALLELMEWLPASQACFISPWEGASQLGKCTDAYSGARGKWLFLKGTLESCDPEQQNS